MEQPLRNLSINLKNLLIYARANVESPHIFCILNAVGKSFDSFINDKKFDFSGLQVEINERIPEEASKIHLLPIGEIRLTENHKVLLLFMETIIERTKLELLREQIETAYALIDIIHFLPEALHGENWNSRAYWKVFVEDQEILDQEFKKAWKKKIIL